MNLPWRGDVRAPRGSLLALPSLFSVLALGVFASGFARPAAADDPFSVQSLELDGRVVQADLADLDGDGRGDLIATTLDGLPPYEHRDVRIFFLRPDGTYPEQADWRGPLPEGVAAYDLADLDESPGQELVVLRNDRLTLLSWSGRVPTSRDLPIGRSPTMGAVADERGVDRMVIVRAGLADEPRLLVPGIGWTAVLAPSGEVLGHLEVGARANYFLPKRPGPVISESEVEIYLDHPRLLVGDVDGDGRGDVVSTTRHDLRVFLQNAEGRFPSRPSQTLALGRVTPQDHVRNSGSVRIEGGDFDGDGRLDLLMSSSAGSLFDAETTVTVHLNKAGRWNLEQADQAFRAESGLNANMVLDLDGDGRVELLDIRIPTSVLQIVEVLVTRSIDAEISIYRHGEKTPFAKPAWQSWQYSVGWSFDTFRTLGFTPTLEADVNGDGIRDLVGSGNGDTLEIRLGDREDGYDEMHAEQSLDTGGRIRFGEIDGDGLSDFVIYSPRRPEKKVHVGTNRGVLPGTIRKPSMREALGG